jgi:predicted nucleic acid-binding protein
MNLAISDTSPLNYLVLTGFETILPRLFGQIVIPTAVMEELSHDGTPPEVKRWASNLPSWVETRVVDDLDHSIKLGTGEVAAISLAQKLQDAFLLTDDRQAANAARQRGVIKVIGTLALLAEADRRGDVDFFEALQKLLSTNFRVSRNVITHVSERVLKNRSHDNEQ